LYFNDGGLGDPKRTAFGYSVGRGIADNVYKNKTENG